MTAEPAARLARALLARPLKRRDVLAATAASLLLTNCGPNQPASPTTTIATSAASGAPPPARTGTAPVEQIIIRLESYNYETPGLGGKALQTLIDEFQALQPGINVEGKNTAPTPDGQMNMIVTEQAAGDPPDIAQLGLNSVDFAIRELGAQPIDQFAPTDEYDELMKRHRLPGTKRIGTRSRSRRRLTNLRCTSRLSAIPVTGSPNHW